MEKIAIIGSGNEWSSIPVVRELSRKGHKIYLFVQNKKSIVLRSKYINGGIYKIPLKLDSRFLSIFLYLCQKNQIQQIIILDDDIKHFFVKNKGKIKNQTLALPSEKSYDISISKHESLSFVRDLKIPIPQTMTFGSREELSTVNFEPGKILVVKGERGDSSSHVRYASNKEQLLEYFDEIYELENKLSSKTTLPMVQEYIGGPTYLTQAISQNGKVKAVIPHYKD